VADDLLSISLNTPIETAPCEDSLVLDLSTAEFTLDGLVLPFSDSLDVFANSLGFRITREGILVVSSGALLSFEAKDFGLAEIVQEIQ